MLGQEIKVLYGSWQSDKIGVFLVLVRVYSYRGCINEKYIFVFCWGCGYSSLIGGRFFGF